MAEGGGIEMDVFDRGDLEDEYDDDEEEGLVDCNKLNK